MDILEGWNIWSTLTEEQKCDFLAAARAFEASQLPTQVEPALDRREGAEIGQ